MQLINQPTTFSNVFLNKANKLVSFLILLQNFCKCETESKDGQVWREFVDLKTQRKYESDDGTEKSVRGHLNLIQIFAEHVFCHLFECQLNC